MIKSISASRILNSRGDYTIKVTVTTAGGEFEASVPSGASVGKHEAKPVEVKKAISNIEKIEKILIGRNEKRQRKIDQILIDLDGTEDKSRLGANTILAVSIAIARAGAAANKTSLYRHLRKVFKKRVVGWEMPRPCFNVINGGAHAGNKIDIQEFMIIPNMRSFKSNLSVGTDIYKKLKGVLKRRYGEQATNLGDEGGFAPNASSGIEILDLLKKAIGKRSIKIGLDVAASEFFRSGKYKFEGKSWSREKLLAFYVDIVDKYPIEFIEDPYDQDDYDGFEMIVEKLGRKITVVGDDLLVTNPERIKIAYHEESCNGIIIKPNQIGSVTETLEAIALAKKYKWQTIISHRSGDTLDDFIADLAVAVGSEYIKSGAPARGERLAKYNRLLEIEEDLSK